MRVLLLGGTGEARELARLLVAAGIEVVSSLAGRTTAPQHPVGEVRTGGFGGPEGLTAWLRTNPVDAVIDATHPFATQITTNATTATTQTATPHLILSRPAWEDSSAEWYWVDTAAAAAELLSRVGSRVFLTIGRQGLDAFAGTGLWTLARCVDPPEPAPTWCELLLARGPFTESDEVELLQRHRIDVLVTKNSGGAATAPKLRAARRLHIPVVIIRRPPLPSGLDVVETPAEALTWLRTNISG
ncbi:cobalt-precorrin-6A reductase [Kribbella jejuensis]|uniref:Precorrin-6A/cobalt-precorrin-6A reductase n=1 Tax=Kribbella jejuensis TaxID=236068 RepID=A0A542EP24_9ACTN|nr:cobalt-precorrin-6A reductase [Kribbella jejuensis]TQJ16994.1 precorrin-6A/cobalt-precorrin-6A reductase [Kribbella jejuensis]